MNEEQELRNEIQKALKKSETLIGEARKKELIKAEVLAANGASLLPVWLVRPRAWSQSDITQPVFDGSGRLLLNKIHKKYE